MPKFKVFYSWQSDLPGSQTRNFIRECIDDAIAFAEESEAIEAERDEATKDTTGSPNIVTTLFSKIDECDLFVADVSLCFSGDVKKEQDGKEAVKRSPNPNVLLELGYAVKTLGWERVICLCDADFGTDYPFDIAHNRILDYSLEGKIKAVVRREIAKSICTDIQQLRGQPPRVRAGVAAHIIGAYDSEQKMVTGKIEALDFCNSESYVLHNNELLEDSKKLLIEITAITERMNNVKTQREEQNEKTETVQHPVMPAIDKPGINKELVHVLAESYKESETFVVWKHVESDKKLIKQWLDIEVGDDFFDFGRLKKTTQLLSHNVTLNGTEDEKQKYHKIEDLSLKLTQLDARITYANTFNGMCFIPLAIQNISGTQDSDIRIIVRVEKGEIVEPDENLICEEFAGMQGLFCRNDDDDSDIGVIAELFILPNDGIIQVEQDFQLSAAIRMPIFTDHIFGPPQKNEMDYKAELREFIASTDGRGFYEYSVKDLRPSECKWLSSGMLIRPVDGQVTVRYRLYSAHSSGDIEGILELI